MKKIIPFLLLAWLWIGPDCSLAQVDGIDEKISGTGVRLSWTAPGDDGLRGRAVAYDLRYSNYYITEANWSEATRVADVPDPAPAGWMENCFVLGLPKNIRYYFAIKTIDDAGNWSLLSNIALKYAEDAICGDTNGDGLVNIGDELCLQNYVFDHGPPPAPLEAGDCNCDGNVNLADAVYLLCYIFRPNSPKPCAACP